jgi:predicted DNA repair protein MutK
VSAGLFGLFDDVAALARLAAASADDVGAAAGRATAKAAGVVVDDTAVTPQYVHGLAAQRELPIIKKIAVGSLRNKLLIILPVALLLSQLLPWLLTPILMLGGAYLCFEATEKIWGAIRGHGGHGGDQEARSEEEVVAGAVRTDLILSAEIMVISLNEVAAEGFWARLAILTVVAVVITVVVYGVVALIVKTDDVGLYLVERSDGTAGRIGRAMVSGMPKVLSVISVVGTAAMLWVGGHIELVGFDELGWHKPYELVHHLEEAVHHAVEQVGGVLAWLTNTAASAAVGLLVGAPLVAVAGLLPFGHKAGTPAH